MVDFNNSSSNNIAEAVEQMVYSQAAQRVADAIQANTEQAQEQFEEQQRKIKQNPELYPHHQMHQDEKRDDEALKKDEELKKLEGALKQKISAAEANQTLAKV